MSGRPVILSGPSGVGKDTVINAWIERRPAVCRVVTCTTRGPRKGEKDGIDYNFVTRKEFEAMTDDGLFLEWKEVHGERYGSPLREVERLLADGRIAILKIDVQGAMAAMQTRRDAVTIFLLPPSLEVLEARIRNRKTDSEQAIQLRMKNALKELEFADKYDHRVVNDDLSRCVEEIDRIVCG
jgi:guanylate kinase